MSEGVAIDCIELSTSVISESLPETKSQYNKKKLIINYAEQKAYR